MSERADKVRAVIAQLLERAETPFAGELTADTPLYGDGLGLDSLATAELSAMLEDELGSDPFSHSDLVPETIGDILAFYGAVSPDGRSAD